MSNQDFGYGQMTPWDTTDDFNVVSFIVSQMIAGMSTMKPVKVVAVHPGDGSPPVAGTVDVQPLVNLVDGAGNKTEWATIFNVPYFRLQGGKWAVIVDPDVGDYGFVVCADRDVSALKSQAPGQAKPSNPSSARKYDPADGVYLGGLFNAVPTATFWLKADGTLQVTDAPGNVISTSSAGIAMTPVGGKPLTVNGDLNVTGKIIGDDGTGGQVSLLTHTHGGVQTGGGTSGPPTPGS